jgi:chromosome segregation ATPase
MQGFPLLSKIGVELDKLSLQEQMSHTTRSSELNQEELIQKLIENLELAETADDLKKNCSKLTSCVDEEVSLARSKLREKINKLEGERDRVLEMQESCKNEIKSLKKQLEVEQTEYKLIDKRRVKSLQTQLQGAINDRDSWKKRAEEIEDVYETMQLVNSLQKSLSNDSEQYKRKIENLEVLLQQRSVECADITREERCLREELHEEKEKTAKLQKEVETLTCQLERINN